MRTVKFDQLPNLPDDVKKLVRDGVYALYTIRHAGAQYVLATSKDEFYFLSGSGAVVSNPGYVSLAVVDIEHAIMLESDATESLPRVNLS